MNCCKNGLHYKNYFPFHLTLTEIFEWKASKMLQKRSTSRNRNQTSLWGRTTKKNSFTRYSKKDLPFYNKINSSHWVYLSDKHQDKLHHKYKKLTVNLYAKYKIFWMCCKRKWGNLNFFMNTFWAFLFFFFLKKALMKDWFTY